MKGMHVWSSGIFVMALSCAPPPSYTNVVENDHASVSGDVLVMAQGAGGGSGGSGGGSTGSGSGGGMGSGSTPGKGFGSTVGWALVHPARWGAGAPAAEPAWYPEALVPARGPAGLRAVEQLGLVQGGPAPLEAAHQEWAVVEVDQVAVLGGSTEA